MDRKEESTKLTRALFGKASNLQRFINKYEKQFKTLSNREIEVLTLIASGNTNPAIARELNISRSTAQNHHFSIRKKLSIRNQADYIKYALAFGLVSF